MILYLQNISQDRFTIFSPAYAWFIQLLGLEHGGPVAHFALHDLASGGGMGCGRTPPDRDGAWLAVIFLLIVDGSYGGSGVFGSPKQFLTARLPAEALIATSLLVFFAAPGFSPR